ncbi:MAG: hypothetical protein WAO08_06040 [Hyphomicrobiaceae bacterium]
MEWLFEWYTWLVTRQWRYSYKTGEPDPGSGWVRRPSKPLPVCANHGPCNWPLLPGRRRV